MKHSAEQMLRTCAMTDTDRELIRLYGLHGSAGADEVRSWFASVNFEELPPECVCMAAVMCAESGYEGAPEQLHPRLKGILRYHRMLNSGLYAAMCAMVREYNKQNIDVLALKGAAIKTGYRPNFVRPMWDVDILVRPQDYDRALEIAQEQGYRGSWAPHSIDLHRGSMESIDLHCVYLRDLGSRKSRDYWPQCRQIYWNDATFFVPEQHALLLQLMVNAHTNFAQHRGFSAPLRWVMDMDALLWNCDDIDWDKLIALAKQLELEAQVSVVVAAYDFVLPGRLEAESILRKLGAQRGAKRLFRFVLRFHQINETFRNPPQGCSGLKLAWIHIRWLWMDCRAGNPGSWFHELCAFPGYLRGELRVKSLWELPAVAVRKFKKHHHSKSV